MSNLSHPVSLLKSEWVSILKSESVQAEKQGKLTKKQLNLIFEQGWFKLFVPVIYGGKQISLSDAMQIEEALASVDGSVGWVVTLCAGAGWFGGFLDQSLSKATLGDAKMCLAGSGGLGTAEKTANGYIVNGKWPYASGATDATVFTANCVITAKGAPLNGADGIQQIMSFAFLKDEVKVNTSWNAMGMAATGSQSFEVADLTVPENRAFEIGKAGHVDAPLYHYPFHQLAEATLAINMCGMAAHFLELCSKIFSEQKKSGKTAFTMHLKLEDTYNACQQKLQAARQKLYYAVDMSWQLCSANKEISPSVLYKVSSAAFTLTRVVRECVNTLYPYCGLEAANKDNDINRVFRDIITAGQHSMLVGDGSD